MKPYRKIRFVVLALWGLQLFCPVLYAQSLDLRASTFVTFIPNANSAALDRQYELRAFFDASYLDKYGAGVGYIYQNQRYNNSDEIGNDLFHVDVWYSAYPELLPGRMTFMLGAYRQQDSDYQVETTTLSPSAGGPGPGSNMGNGMRSGRVSTSVTRSTDSLDVFNPEVSFLNYNKTFYLDLGYARSDYQSTAEEIGDLQVTQWSATTGFAFNERYDWLQARIYRIKLSNDVRSPGTDATNAAVLSWTHWLKSRPAKLESLTLKALLGKRIYAVDSEIRKVYNLTDLEKGSIIVGTNWAISEATKLYVYGGYETFEDLADEEDYNSAFIDLGLSIRW